MSEPLYSFGPYRRSRREGRGGTGWLVTRRMESGCGAIAGVDTEVEARAVCDALNAGSLRESDRDGMRAIARAAIAQAKGGAK